MAKEKEDKFLVTLTWPELLIGATIGVRRHIEAIRRGYRPKHGMSDKKAWGAHIEGSCGELAYAKFAGVYWEGPINTFKKGGDVGDIQVRTRSKDEWDLIVRDDDDDKNVFVLVVGMAPIYRMVGWLRAKDAKKEEYKQFYGNRPPAFFVPQNELKSFPIKP